MRSNSYASEKHSHPLSPNGFQIFPRKGSTRLIVSFSIKGSGQFRKSLGTSDFDTAYRTALFEWHSAISKAESGILARGVTFQTLARKYLAKLEEQVEQGFKPKQQLTDRTYLAERYFIPFFGEKRIGEIASKTMAEYLDWRIRFWENPENQKHPITTKDGHPIRRGWIRKRVVPKPSTLARENVQLRHILRFAVEQNLIASIPACEIPPVKLNPRPGFSRAEIQRLKQHSLDRCTQAGIHMRVQNDRMKLHSYVMFACATGMRVTELSNLRWGHIQISTNQFGKREVTIYAHGKGKRRDFVAAPVVESYLKILKELFEQEVGRQPDHSDPVFANSKGEPIDKFRKGLDALLESAGLLHDHKGAKRSASSFRHFYITEMKRAGVDTDLLSLNVGTSPRMIQENYSKIRAVEEREKLAIDLIGG